MKINLMNVILKVLALFFVLLVGCDKKEQNVEISDELQKIMDNGVTIDSITLDYATMFTNEDSFFVIEPSPIEDFVDKNEAILFFKFVSQSRDDLFEYYNKVNEQNLEQGFTKDWITKYYDKLENISVEVKKNDDEFYEVDVDSSVVKFIETPDISSGGSTFAGYEMTLDEFIAKYNDSFPHFFVLMFDDSNMKSNSYVFKIKFKISHNKEIVLHTDQIRF